jgi:hypothetical protein
MENYRASNIIQNAQKIIVDAANMSIKELFDKFSKECVLEIFDKKYTFYNEPWLHWKSGQEPYYYAVCKCLDDDKYYTIRWTQYHEKMDRLFILDFENWNHGVIKIFHQPYPNYRDDF